MSVMSRCKFNGAFFLHFIILLQFTFSDADNTLTNLLPRLNGRGVLQSALESFKQKRSIPCTCGIFLDGQLTGDSRITPGEGPAFVKEMDFPIYPCGQPGNKLCSDRCLNLMIQHMPTAGPLICSSINRDCQREKATLFIRNCDSSWKPTGFTAGKEFCCSNGSETKCPPSVPFSRNSRSSLLGDLLGSSSNRRTIPEFLLDIADSAADLATDVLGA